MPRYIYKVHYVPLLRIEGSGLRLAERELSTAYHILHNCGLFSSQHVPMELPFKAERRDRPVMMV